MARIGRQAQCPERRGMPSLAWVECQLPIPTSGEIARQWPMQTDRHWSEVYRTKCPDRVSWYQPSPEPSLRALDQSGVAVSASLIDVGGGASGLVDALIERGWSDLTVLDIAAPALD